MPEEQVPLNQQEQSSYKLTEPGAVCTGCAYVLWLPFIVFMGFLSSIDHRHPQGLQQQHGKQAFMLPPEAAYTQTGVETKARTYTCPLDHRYQQGLWW